jgi:hypothetical protein
MAADSEVQINGDRQQALIILVSEGRDLVVLEHI